MYRALRLDVLDMPPLTVRWGCVHAQLSLLPRGVGSVGRGWEQAGILHVLPSPLQWPSFLQMPVSACGAAQHGPLC